MAEHSIPRASKLTLGGAALNQADQHPSRLRRVRTFAVKAALLVTLPGVALLAAACGGGSPAGVASLGSSTSTTVALAGNSGSATETPAQLAADTKLAQCIRKHGFPKFPDPPYSNGELKDLGFTKQAIAPLESGACHAVALAAGTVETPAQLQQRLAAALKVAKCMRAHGITNFPDPSTKDGGFSGFSMSPTVLDEPKYSAAAKACNAPPGGPPIQATK